MWQHFLQNEGNNFERKFEEFAQGKGGNWECLTGKHLAQ
jgi:hypothetical protein